MGYTESDGVNTRFTAETTDGEIVMIVRKDFDGNHTQILIAEDGRKFKPAAALKVEPLDAEEGSLPATEAPANPGEAPYEQVETDFANAEPASAVPVVHTEDGPQLDVEVPETDEEITERAEALVEETLDEDDEEQGAIPA